MPNNYVLLDRIELNATTASVTFDNIPQTGYTDLKIVISARDTSTSDAKGSYYTIAFNGGSSYAGRYLQGNGSSANSGTLAQLAGIADTSASTANTFCNDEIYIPNYRSTTAKAYSVDSVTENNAAGAYATLVAGSWSGAAVTTITFTPSVGSFVAGSTFSLYGLAQVGTTPAIAPKANGGNVIGTDGTYWYHAFLSNGTFTPQVGFNADVLVVAGGGGGGGVMGGGGGAGGLLYTASQALAVSTSYAITIGSGGAGGVGQSGRGTNGSNSSLAALAIAIGGGGGGAQANPDGIAGGSGGGRIASGTAAAGTSGQGNSGGIGSESGAYGTGGGGGAGAVGGNGSSSAGGAGGAGSNTYSAWATATASGVSGFYAGGGGGSQNGGFSGGAGGSGGGGAGASGADGTPGSPATINTGGGGGGAAGDTPVSATGGSGGSGIVIIRYLVA
jgi:hypothetical protein